MNFRLKIKEFAHAPIHRHQILDILKDYKRPNDKISELIKNDELISLKKGLYIVGPNTDLSPPEPFLIANHLRAPSYISIESALSYWGLIPERVYQICSASIKTSKIYRTTAGRYSFNQLPTPYFSRGIQNIKLTSGDCILIASPEKALCDKIILTPNVNLRSTIQTHDFLLEDLRIDLYELQKLNASQIESWIVDSPKKNSLKFLVKVLYKI